MIERGTHPKMKFQANLKDRERGLAPEATKVERKRRLTPQEREDKAYQAVYSKYMSARKNCGQNASMSYESVRDVLQKQVRTIKSRYRCKAVKFRVTVEDGKAKVKAVPLGDAVRRGVEDEALDLGRPHRRRPLWDRAGGGPLAGGCGRAFQRRAAGLDRGRPRGPVPPRQPDGPGPPGPAGVESRLLANPLAE